ncbi:P-selectin glycoprotein ligand 1 [Erpetoichthys calabaricus]|uniref:P-selectin glycoprotein ligand 1 n=1 Tax=Erpetoichthys calabaricus TaxID=27687 RepID=UPI002233F2F3|nr:P-selectin glycoprotein ligand 1 [Erpetoichthys calabaricus]
MASLWFTLSVIFAFVSPAANQDPRNTTMVGAATNTSLGHSAETSTISTPISTLLQESKESTEVRSNPAIDTTNEKESTPPAPSESTAPSNNKGRISGLSTPLGNAEAKDDSDPTGPHKVQEGTTKDSDVQLGSSSSGTTVGHEPPSTSTARGTSAVLVTNSSKEINVQWRTQGTSRRPGPTMAAKTDVNSSATSAGEAQCTIESTKRGKLVSHCLIAIAVLSGIATAFIISTIVLCTKLSSNKQTYKVKDSLGTEMVCISSLLPDSEVMPRKVKLPKSNALLIASLEENEGDDLTLNSFVPDH